MFDYDKFEKIVDDVHQERRRQERLFKEGEHSKTIQMCCNLERLAILTEETGEVAKEVCETIQPSGGSKAHLREELVQVAATAAAWIEALDSEK